MFILFCFTNVNMTAQVLDCFLHSCKLLENLFIDNSESLNRIIASGNSLSLKHLKVIRCRNMKSIGISALKFMSFTLEV